jgi:cytochrome oxidase Cu insertion factor (SCO1/SenC/PrrC family)
MLRVVLLSSLSLLALALLLTIVLGDSSKGTATDSGSSTGQQSNSRFDGAAFPPAVSAHDFTLTDQHRQSVSLSAYHGQVVALAFLNSNCRACLLAAQQVRGALDELESHPPAAPHVQTIFVSTDPKADSVASVGRFLSQTSLSGRVEYLTGTAARLRPVWRAYGIAPVSAGKSASEAATTVLLVDREGVERVGFGLEQLTPESISHDIRRLQAG